MYFILLSNYKNIGYVLWGIKTIPSPQPGPPPVFEIPGSVLGGGGGGRGKCKNHIIKFALVRFFVSHSRGFFNCLSKDGKVYDEIKHVWLQARQVSVSGSEGIGFFFDFLN